MPRLDREVAKRFFVFHLEKMVLVVVLLLFVVFVYSGWGLEGLPDSQTPKSLETLASNANSHISTDTWAEISPEYHPPTGHVERAQQTEIPTNGVAYAPLKPYKPANRPSGIKRVDPEMLPPIEVEAVTVVGPLAYQKQRNDKDLLEELVDTEVIVKKAKKKRGSKRRDTQADLMASFGGDEEEYVDPSFMASGAGPDIAGEAEAGAPASAAGRDLPGYRPSQGSFESIAKPSVIVAVKAVVPYKEQWKKYEQALAQAMDYNPARDTPKYLGFVAERAEVSADPNAELQWEQLTHTNQEVVRIKREPWAGVADEMADPRYLLPNKLTMPIPPMMMRDLEQLALHSRVPRYIEEKDAGLGLANASDLEEEEPEPTAMGDELLPDTPFAVALGGSSDLGAGLGEETGSFGAFGDMMTGGPASRRTPSASAAFGPQVDYLMVRFYDFDARIGKKYRYRIQVFIEDPNRPMQPLHAPRDRALADEVAQRMLEVNQQEAATKTPRIGWIRTDWSDPSAVVSVEMPQTALAGEVPSVRQVTVEAPVTIPAPTVEPTAKVMAVVFDPQRSVDVPAMMDAARGTLLNFMHLADVIHPVTLQFKKLENEYPIKTDKLLVDFRGGEPLPADEGEELRTPGELIFLDEDGNFMVRSELDDKDLFELYQVPEIIEGGDETDPGGGTAPALVDPFQ